MPCSAHCAWTALPCSSLLPALQAERAGLGPGLWLRHLQLTSRSHPVLVPSAWDKLSICRTLLKLEFSWPPRPHMGPAKISGERTRCHHSKEGEMLCWELLLPRCLMGLSRYNPSLVPEPSRGLKGAERCLTIPTATFLLAQGSWEVSWTPSPCSHSPLG